MSGVKYRIEVHDNGEFSVPEFSMVGFVDIELLYEEAEGYYKEFYGDEDEN